MKVENKCFFSVSLENGITITGENLSELLDFLYDAHSAFFEMTENYRKKHFQRLADHAFLTLNSIYNAIDTINNHKKED